jgi:hypothetical protein
MTLDTPTAASLAAFPVPEVLTPVNVLITAVVASSTAAGVVPTDVIAPAPNTISVLPAFATGAFPTPVVQEAPNTLVFAPRAAAGIEMLPPGEQVRVSVPVLTVSAMTVSPRRVGPALSIYASTVVQTEQDFGGAFAYYRLSDETSTLTDEVSGRHGGWVGTKSLVGGALVDDPDTAVYFNGNDTKGQVGVIPPLNVEAEDPAGLPGNVDPYSNEPYRTGAGAGFWFYCPEGMTAERYLLSFSITGSATDTPMTVRVSGGQLVVRIRVSNSNWVELSSGLPVNDGQWHFGFVTTGRVLGDESPLGASTNRLYVDGSLVNSNTLNSLSWYGDFLIGALTSTSTTGLWEGGIDEVALYDYAPSRWEVLEQWNQGRQLSGPPMRFEPPPTGVVAALPTVTLRRSAVRPLNEFYDDFNAPFIDLSKWRDASDTASIVNGALSLSADGERVLTQDYFQAKDSSLIVRVDKLPLFQGELFIGLTNENDIEPDWQFGGPNQFDTFRRHRDIGFKITRSQVRGQTVTVVQFVAAGVSFNGTNTRTGTLAYIPDDPNFPSPMKWLRLDIDPGRHGGATWFTGSDGMNWTERYDVHGGKVNALTTQEIGPNGNIVNSTRFVYEDVNDFYLFDRDEVYPEETEWRGYMRVLIQASKGSAATDARVDNLNVLPAGVGNPVDMLAKPALVQTGSYNEYLIYALSPRLYSSASDIQVAAVPAKASVGFVTPPSPVYVFAVPAAASVVFRDLLRAGDAVPIAISSDAATATGSMKVPAAAGQATDKVMQPNQAQAYVSALPAFAINTDQSSPAPVVTLTKRTITITRRPTRVLVTQN